MFCLIMAAQEVSIWAFYLIVAAENYPSSPLSSENPLAKKGLAGVNYPDLSL